MYFFPYISTLFQLNVRYGRNDNHDDDDNDDNDDDRSKCACTIQKLAAPCEYMQTVSNRLCEHHD